MFVRLIVRLCMGIVNGIGNAIGRAFMKREMARGELLPGFLVRASKMRIDGVTVTFGTVGRPDTAIYATAVARRETGAAPRLVRERGWGDRERPAEVAGLPEREPGLRCDDAAVGARLAFDASWERLCAAVEHVVMVSDGESVTAWVVADRQEQVDLLGYAVAAVARWDVEVARMLASLPEATTLYDDRLAPAVLLPGDVRVGMADQRLVVTLGNRSRPVERDPARILAAVADLRASYRGGPFR